MDGRGWFKEPARHSLAKRGIKTRGIENPYTKPSVLTKMVCGERECEKEFIESGLDNINPEDITEVSFEIMEYMDRKNFKIETEYRSFAKDVSHVMHHDFPTYVHGLRKDVNSEALIDDIFTIGIEPSSIHVFGSRVSGYWKSDSDLDVGIVIKKNPDLMEKVGQIWNVEKEGTWMFFKFLLMSVYEVLTDRYNWMPSDITIRTEGGNGEIELDIGLMVNDPDPTLPSIKIWEAS